MKEHVTPQLLSVVALLKVLNQINDRKKILRVWGTQR